MLIDDEAAKHIVDRLDVLEAATRRLDEQIKSLKARQVRQENLHAEHHDDIRQLAESFEAMAALVRIMLRDKYGNKGELKT